MSIAQQFLEEFYLSCGNLHEACKKVGLTRKQVMDFAKKNPKFAEKLWEAYEGIIDLAETSLLKLGLFAQDSGALKSYLGAKAKNRGYGSTEIVTKQEIVPGIQFPENQDPQIVFRNKIQYWSTEKIEEQLKQMKKVKV